MIRRLRDWIYNRFIYSLPAKHSKDSLVNQVILKEKINNGCYNRSHPTTLICYHTQEDELKELHLQFNVTALYWNLPFIRCRWSEHAITLSMAQIRKLYKFITKYYKHKDVPVHKSTRNNYILECECGTYCHTIYIYEIAKEDRDNNEVVEIGFTKDFNCSRKWGDAGISWFFKNCEKELNYLVSVLKTILN